MQWTWTIYWTEFNSHLLWLLILILVICWHLVLTLILALHWYIIHIRCVLRVIWSYWISSHSYRFCICWSISYILAITWFLIFENRRTRTLILLFNSTWWLIVLRYWLKILIVLFLTLIHFFLLLDVAYSFLHLNKSINIILLLDYFLLKFFKFFNWAVFHNFNWL